MTVILTDKQADAVLMKMDGHDYAEIGEAGLYDELTSAWDALKRKVKVFACAEDEWIAARSPEEAKAFYVELYSMRKEDEGDVYYAVPEELTDEQMRSMKFKDDDDDTIRTFAAQLEKCLRDNPKLAETPFYFAGSE